MLRTGNDITLVGYGPFINVLLETAEHLAERGIQAEVVKLGCITPLDDPEPVLNSVRKTGHLLVAEEAVSAGCVGQRLAAALLLQGVPVKGFALENLGSSMFPTGPWTSCAICAA